MSVSKTDICNLALGEIGVASIADIADDTNEARWCRKFYDSARDQCLRLGQWNFAIKRQTLSETLPAPDFGWLHSYALPNDFIRGCSLNERPWNHSSEWTIESRHLLTDWEEANLRYVFRQLDTSLYDPLFVNFLAIMLASKIATPITGDRQKTAELIARLQNIDGPAAKRTDANEGKPRVISPLEDSRLVASRFAGYPYNWAYGGPYEYIGFPDE